MKKFYERYNQFEKTVIGLIMCLLILMGFAQVIFRFVLKAPLAWTEELLTFSMIWVAYLGASTATNERKHIIVSMFVDMLPIRIRKSITIFSQLLWFGCAFIMAYLSLENTLSYIDRGAVTLGGQYPYWVAAIAIPVGMLLMAIRVVILMCKTMKGERDTLSQEEIVREEMES